MKKYEQSIFIDNLFRIMPELQFVRKNSKDYIDPFAAKMLYSIWRNGCSINNRLYRRPTIISHDDIQQIQKSGLAKQIGDKIEITDKGANVIRVMILGDNKSIFDENGKDISYNEALSNIKNVKVARNKKVANYGWWDRYK